MRRHLSWIANELRGFRSLEPDARRQFVRGVARRARVRSSPGDDLPLTARSILFVCHGNIMRSALAHALLAARLGDSVLIRSAGTHAKRDDLADPRMRNAALEVGVSLDGHRAIPLTADLVDQADIVFVMDYLNEATVLARHPQSATKLKLLGSCSPNPGNDVVIVDPYMGDEAAARRCAARIRSSVDYVARRLGAQSTDSASMPGQGAPRGN